MNNTPQNTSITIIPLAGAYHGGAWKVAYADFVTAMMAFFLLLWLLNVTTEEQKNAISNYFDPSHPKVSDTMSGAGGVLGGLSMSPQGAMATEKQSMSLPQARRKSETTKGKKAGEARNDNTAKEKAKEELAKKENEKYKKTADQIKQAIAEDPDLQQLSKNIIVDMTPEGLRIQIVDEEGQAMFAKGSAQMFEKTQKLMEKLSDIINDNTENELSIRGHTDGTPYGAGASYTNWELSSDRANASRRVLLDSGFPAQRINNVVGKADTEHLLPDDPANARNRRISIILLKEELTNPDYGKKLESEAQKYSAEQSGDNVENDGTPGIEIDESPASSPTVPVGTFRRTPGQVEFP